MGHTSETSLYAWLFADPCPNSEIYTGKLQNIFSIKLNACLCIITVFNHTHLAFSQHTALGIILKLLLLIFNCINFSFSFLNLLHVLSPTPLSVPAGYWLMRGSNDYTPLNIHLFLESVISAQLNS